MVVTVNLNPNIDRYIKLDTFVYGGLNRVTESRDDATSKGINVARVLNAFGIEAVCTGFMYEKNGRPAITQLEKEGIECDYIWQPGNMRTNLKLYDCASGILTEVNEKGTPVKESDLQTLKEKVLFYSNKNNMIVFIGSVPPECPPGFFGELIALANENGAMCVLDADGEVLRAGVEKRPYLVKVNRLELMHYAISSLETENEMIDALKSMIHSGVSIAVVSLGSEGALLTDGRSVLKAQGIPIKAVSPTGSGDTMVAALVTGIILKQPLKQMLKCACAASAATALCEGTKLMTMDLYNGLLHRAEVETIQGSAD